MCGPPPSSDRPGRLAAVPAIRWGVLIRTHHMDTTARRRRRASAPALLMTLLIALLIALLTGCAPAVETTEEPEPGAQGDVIAIVDFEYQVPASVPAGSQITVRNDDGVGHTVTSDEDGVFDVTVAPGAEATLTVPDEPGEYPFHCTPHPTMTATLVVQ